MNCISIPTEPVQPRKGLQSIKPHMVSANAQSADKIRINIASNESAFGASQSSKAACAQAVGVMERYAANADLELSHTIASHFNLKPSGVVCGYGSDDLLTRLASAYLRPSDELICSVNGYQKFPKYAYINDAHPVRANDCNFTVDIDQVLSCVTPRTRIIMIANPDNPTGTWISGEQVRQLHLRLPDNVLLVLDSAYLEYVDSSDFENPAALVEEFDNIVMTRTFSKIYGLAGLRLGWLYAPPKIADIVRCIGLTFPISNVAYAGGKAALEDIEHRNEVKQTNQRIRADFEATLANLEIEVYPSQTNFILANFEGCRFLASEVYNHLHQHGILTRRFPAFSFRNCIRFTIGLESEMQQVATCLTDLFSSSIQRYD